MAKLGINHPTCHKIPLAVAAKVVAFVDMIFGLFGLVWFVVMLSTYNIISLDPFDYLSAAGTDIIVKTPNVKGHELTSSTPAPLGIMMEPLKNISSNNNSSSSPVTDYEFHNQIISLSLAGFYTAVNLIVFVLLLFGIHKRSPGRCLEWFHIRCAIFFFKLIILFMYLISGQAMTHLYHHIPFVLSMIAHLYGIWVVHAFVIELKEARLQEKIEESRRQQELAREDTDSPNGIERVLQKRVLDDQLKRHIFNF